jgi:hypothetical protein
MRAEHGSVIEQLRRARWRPLAQLLVDARPAAGSPSESDAAVVLPYRWLLSRVGDGVRLTQAGYLPPAIVEETMRTLGWDAHWPGKNNREDQTYPVLELRDLARRLGLLRVSRGLLTRTRAGCLLTDDPVALWWHLADRLPVARGEIEQQAGLLYLLAVAAGRPRPLAIVASGLAALGVVDSATRRPPVELDALDLTRSTWAVFRQLGLLSRRARDDAPPGPGAVQLARAALHGRDAVDQPLAPGQAPAANDGAIGLTVTLRDTEPPVWRRLVVPTSLSLWQLHEVLQTAMGWRDYHLHLFEIADVSYGDVEDFPGELGDEATFTVGEAAGAADLWRYEYDFGDGWDHDIRVGERLAPSAPRCLDGARACPPEDCGGPSGYEHLLVVLADPSHAEHAELLEWLGGEFDPDAFDVAEINALLRFYDENTRQGTGG